MGSIQMSSTPLKKRPKVDQKVKSPSPTSSMSVVNGVKKKKKRVDGSSDKPVLSKEQRGAKKLKRAKQKLALEESSTVELIEKMKARVEKADSNDHLVVYMRMYTQLRKIIRKCEKGCMAGKPGSGAYQLATLYTQMRETISDIRSLTDLSDHADTLIEKVMRPLFTTMVQNTSNSMYTVKLKLKDKLNEKRVRRAFEDIDEITVEAGKHLQVLYDNACNEIRRVLLGENTN